MAHPPLLRSVGPITRNDTFVFQFQVSEGTFYKMPAEISAFEEILSARGFTLHEEYFVNHPMALLLEKHVSTPRVPLSSPSSF